MSLTAALCYAEELLQLLPTNLTPLVFPWGPGFAFHLSSYSGQMNSGSLRQAQPPCQSEHTSP